MRFFPRLFASGIVITSALHAHVRQTPPTAAEIAWSRVTARWESLRRDAKAFLPPRPPVPDGVTDVDFNEFFRPVVGDRGMEITDKLRALDGQQIRLVGFMVRQALPTLGVLLLAPHPIQVDEVEYGACDDLPPQVVRVFVPLPAGVPVPLTPGPLLLTGRLELGQQAEPDGRNSFIRLRLDSPVLTPLVTTRPVAAAATFPPAVTKISSQP